MKEFNLKRSWGVARLNLNRLRLMLIIVATVSIVAVLPNLIVGLASTTPHQTPSISFFIFSLCILTPILLASRNFTRAMRLGAKKKDFFLASLFILAIVAFGTATFSTAFHYAVDMPLTNSTRGIELWSPQTVFGWAGQFPLVTFLQTFGFLFMLSVLLFIITSIQDRWIGWAVDGLLVACISVFSAVGVLRQHVWGNLFNLIITGNPALQILFTIFFGLALYCLYLVILRNKKV